MTQDRPKELVPDSFALPSDLTDLGRKAAQAITAFLDREGMLRAPGLRVFRSPAEWTARGEEYVEHSLLVVVHDGGDHAPAFAWECECYGLIDALDAELRPLGVFVVQCTTWFSAVHSA